MNKNCAHQCNNTARATEQIFVLSSKMVARCRYSTLDILDKGTYALQTQKQYVKHKVDRPSDHL